MYVKFQRATVFVGETLAKQTPASKLPQPHQIATLPSITLWASRPFSVSRGRAVAVRKTGQSVEVGFVSVGSTSMVWLPPERVLSQAQISRWLAISSFRRT